MLRKLSVIFALVAMAFSLVASPAIAAVTFDPATGVGFVGKGDVQQVFGWNNKQLQDNAANVRFQVVSTEVTEYAWFCTKDGVNEQERNRTLETSLQGVFDTVARDKNQVTGFNLLGYVGTPIVETELDGPEVDSCPNPNSGYYLSISAGDGAVTSQTGGIQVSVDGTHWITLQ